MRVCAPAAVVLALVVLPAAPAFADDSPPGEKLPHCDGRKAGDPCVIVDFKCGTCVEAPTPFWAGGHVVCDDIHTCRPGDSVGCSTSTGTVPSVLAVAGGLVLVWLGRRRERR